MFRKAQFRMCLLVMPKPHRITRSSPQMNFTFPDSIFWHPYLYKNAIGASNTGCFSIIADMELICFFLLDVIYIKNLINFRIIVFRCPTISHYLSDTRSLHVHVFLRISLA